MSPGKNGLSTSGRADATVLMDISNAIIAPDETVLVTGAGGFIGMRVVESLLVHGCRNVRCFLRPSGKADPIDQMKRRVGGDGRVEIFRGNLLSREDCIAATRGVAVIYHLAAGRGDMIADTFMNSVVTTRNLLEATLQHNCLKRFVNVSSFSVYANRQKPRGRLLDETCPVESSPEKRGDAYTYGKVKQDEIVTEYARKFGIPCVIVRPGCVFGAGNETITNRVGIGTFGIFLHLGGANAIPFTYVDNCADAIVLVGLKPNVDGEVFNVVDDDLPSSRRFLALYKRNVRRFHSIYVPHAVSYLLCCLWEKYSQWSEGQLPPAFNCRSWHAFWKRTHYSNAKLKARLGWAPRVSSTEALNRYFASCRNKAGHA
jgi:nucleoside-diphosphate-sugar epimerase